MSFPSHQPPTGAVYGAPAHLQPKPQRSRRNLIIGLIAALLLAGGGIGVYLVAFSPITIRGSITLTAGGTGYGNTECHGTGAYAEVTGGAQVEITDGAGKTIALGHLGPGKVTDDKGCQFAFAVDAPRADIYGLKIGRMGEIKMSRAQAEAGVNLTLGR